MRKIFSNLFAVKSVRSLLKKKNTKKRKKYDEILQKHEIFFKFIN